MVVDHGMVVRMDEMAVSKFKATCLAALERVRRTGRPLRVTRFGRPLADVVPPTTEARTAEWLGVMQGRGHVQGDMVAPIAGQDEWDALR
jgi:antitoxin (DNA-binding transcriptional repressor) of toxin-antitoxin stability system